MKNLLFIGIALIFSNLLQAQSVTPSVISSAGTFLSAGGYTLSQTIGEMSAVSTLGPVGGYILTQGFQQTENASTGTLTVKIKVFLEGPYSGGGVMSSSLSTLAPGVFPLAQPFNNAPWNYAGTETIAVVPASTTDWVLIEAHANSTTTLPLAQKAAILKSDGTVWDIDGTQGIKMSGLTSGSTYYFVVRSRNHIAVMSSVGIVVPNALNYDFTTAATQAFGTNQQAAVSGGFALFVGDLNASGIISVTDYNYYALAPSGTGVYSLRDLNYDKLVTVADFNKYKTNASRIGIPQIRY